MTLNGTGDAWWTKLAPPESGAVFLGAITIYTMGHMINGRLARLEAAVEAHQQCVLTALMQRCVASPDAPTARLIREGAE